MSHESYLPPHNFTVSQLQRMPRPRRLLSELYLRVKDLFAWLRTSADAGLTSG
jgi:hypothetical protein